MYVYYRFLVLSVNVGTQPISEILQKTILEENFFSVTVGRKKKFAMLKTRPRLSCCRHRKRDFYEIRRDPVDSEPAERTTFRPCFGGNSYKFPCAKLSRNNPV